MKRTLVAICLFCFVAAAVVADTSSYYPVRLDVIKVYSHAEGFKIVYRKGPSGMAELYLPITWFVPGGKGDLVRAHDPSYPYLVVYYKDGKFDHLRLYVQDSYQDESWGVLPSAEGKGKFAVEDIKLEF